MWEEGNFQQTVMTAVIPIFIPHEGCPHRCAFCNQRYTRSAPPITAEEVQQAIRAWLARFSPERRAKKPQIAFYGGSFTALPQPRQDELLQAARPFLDSGQAGGIRLSTRPDAMDATTAQRLKAAGVRLVELGVQSCDDAVLAQAGRGHDFTASLAASGVIRDAGLQLGWQLLVGLPGEGFSGIRRMVQECERVRPDCIRLYPLLVLRGSQLAADWQAGRFQPLTLAKAVVFCAFLKKRLDAAGLAIIRLGLQTGPELEAETLAGPLHPAFGELVASRVMFQKARKLLAVQPEQPCTLHLAPQDLSLFIGLKRANLKRLAALADQGLIARFRLQPDPGLSRGSLTRCALQ